MAWVAMSLIPGTPHERESRLAWETTRYIHAWHTPEYIALADEMHRLRKQIALIDTILLPAVSAIAVAMVARIGNVLRPREILSLTVGAVAVGAVACPMALQGSAELDGASLVAAAVFGIAIWLIEQRRGGDSARITSAGV